MVEDCYVFIKLMKIGNMFAVIQFLSFAGCLKLHNQFICMLSGCCGESADITIQWHPSFAVLLSCLQEAHVG